MSGYGYGGVPNMSSGQIAMDGSAHQAPAPNGSGPKYQVFGFIVTAPAGADVYVGPNTSGNGGEPSNNPLTTGTGLRIPQNTTSPFIPSRYLPSFIGASGTVSYLILWG